MREIAEESVKQRAEGRTRWWNSGDKCDLILTSDDSGLISFELTYFGNILCGGRDNKTSFGVIGEDFERFRQFKGSNLVTTNEVLTVNLRNTLSKVVNNIESLEEGLRKSICEIIRETSAEESDFI